MKAITLEVEQDGTLTIPSELMRAMKLSPLQAVTVTTQDDALIVVPSHHARLDRLGKLLRRTLQDLHWSEIEAGRDERCF